MSQPRCFLHRNLRSSDSTRSASRSSLFLCPPNQSLKYPPLVLLSRSAPPEVANLFEDDYRKRTWRHRSQSRRLSHAYDNQLSWRLSRKPNGGSLELRTLHKEDCSRTKFPREHRERGVGNELMVSLSIKRRADDASSRVDGGTKARALWSVVLLIYRLWAGGWEWRLTPPSQRQKKWLSSKLVISTVLTLGISTLFVLDFLWFLMLPFKGLWFRGG